MIDSLSENNTIDFTELRRETGIDATSMDRSLRTSDVSEFLDGTKSLARTMNKDWSLDMDALHVIAGLVCCVCEIICDRTASISRHKFEITHQDVRDAICHHFGPMMASFAYVEGYALVWKHHNRLLEVKFARKDSDSDVTDARRTTSVVPTTPVGEVIEETPYATGLRNLVDRAKNAPHFDSPSLCFVDMILDRLTRKVATASVASAKSRMPKSLHDVDVEAAVILSLPRRMVEEALPEGREAALLHHMLSLPRNATNRSTRVPIGDRTLPISPMQPALIIQQFARISSGRNQNAVRRNKCCQSDFVSGILQMIIALYLDQFSIDRYATETVAEILRDLCERLATKSVGKCQTEFLEANDIKSAIESVFVGNMCARVIAQGSSAVRACSKETLEQID